MVITEVGGVRIEPQHKASCHYRGVKLLVELPNGLVNPMRCNCSICQKKGAIMCGVPLNAVKIVSGMQDLTLYQFNTNTAKHYFCKHCGIYTHHQRRSNPGQYSINVACLEGINALALQNIPIGDGINHSKDQ